MGLDSFLGATYLDVKPIGGPIVTNKWYHLVWSHSGDTATAYIDGSVALLITLKITHHLL